MGMQTAKLINTRWCCGHQKRLPIEAFGRHKGLCRPCNSAAAKKWRDDNPKRLLATRVAYRKSAVYGSPRHIRALVQQIKDRCKKRNIPFNLTVGDIKLPDVCPIFGFTLIRGFGDKAVNVDRIEPHLGYVRGNIVCVSGFANRLKQNATLQQMEAVVKFYRRFK